MSRVAITRQENVYYPHVENYSPKELYPEYKYGLTNISRSNEVYGLIRKCFMEFGCDMVNYNTNSWNPLGNWIKSGDKVFILTNFVMHRRPFESRERFDAKCTNGSVIRAIMDYACIATGDPGLVSFGNAPLQSCEYERVTNETGATSISKFYKDIVGAEVGPFDLRLLKSRWTNYGAQIDVKRESLENAVQIDLGSSSRLDELYVNKHDVQVRVSDYSPIETMSYHGKGKHIYLINKRILDADVIISIPKLKTHQKVGITCALKGTVGTIGRKECLAHHRFGSPEIRGDEYPRKGYFRDLSSYMSEKACYLGTDVSSNIYRVTSKFLSRAMRLGPKGITYGAWHGNDTAWRMTLDIARIVRYGRLDGTMSDVPIREHISLVDGIVAGEGEGPMVPIPRRLGVVIFSPDICAVDTACASIMGFDPKKIKLVSNSFQCGPYPLTKIKIEDINYYLNGKMVDRMEIKNNFPPHFKPPKGWVGMIEDKY